MEKGKTFLKFYIEIILTTITESVIGCYLMMVFFETHFRIWAQKNEKKNKNKKKCHLSLCSFGVLVKCCFPYKENDLFKFQCK